MPRRPQLVTGEVYHISSRAVGDTIIFDAEDDFYRGIFSIYEFNNTQPVSILRRREERKAEKLQEKLAEAVRGSTSYGSRRLDGRDKLVEVMAFSFMPNHLHLILKQLKDGGITEFMRKVGTGFAYYFNKKYQRKGHLFSKFYPVHIKTDDQLKTAFTYVHTNLISVIEPGWKEHGIREPEKVREFLENNKRHSYLDYLGKKNFPSVTEREFLLEIMGGSAGCKADVENWITHKEKIKSVGDFLKDA